MVRAWGAGETNTNSNPDRGQSMVPVYMPVFPYGDGQLLGTCKEVAAGLYHTVAIRVRDESDPLNGTVVAWGAGTLVQNSPNFGQCIIPTNLGSCKKVAAGFYHSMALKENGTVVAWGAQTTNQAYPNLGQATVPSALGSCIEIAAGGLHSVALKSSTPLNSTNVVAWGAGNTNSGVYWSYGQTIVPPSLGTCTKIAAGPFHTVVLQANGTVRALAREQLTQVPILTTDSQLCHLIWEHVGQLPLEAHIPQGQVTPQPLLVEGATLSLSRYLNTLSVLGEQERPTLVFHQTLGNVLSHHLIILGLALLLVAFTRSEFARVLTYPHHALAI